LKFFNFLLIQVKLNYRTSSSTLQNVVVVGVKVDTCENL